MSTRRCALGALSPFILLTLGLVSCSDDDSLLRWDESNRAGLGVPADTVVSTSLVTANAVFWEPQATGSTGHFLVGRLDRAGLVEGATVVFSDAYLRWNLEDLPSGEVLSVRLQFVLHDVDDAGATLPATFDLRAYEAAGAWTEDSLGLYLTPPAAGEFFGHSGPFDLGGLSDSSDVAFSELFVSPNHARLDELVQRWLDEPETNHGLVIRASGDSEEQGFLRFVAHEGRPVGSAFENIETRWPQLHVEIDVGEGDVETRILAAAADGYQMYGGDGRGMPGRIDPETQLLLSSGYVQPLIFKIDLAGLIDGDPQRFPEGLAVHQATLTLTQVSGDEWSLAEDEELSLQVFETPTEWTEAAPPAPGEIEGPRISSATIVGGDPTVVLDIRDTVQQLVEGRDLSIVVLTEAGASIFRTILFQGRTAPEGAPEVRIVFTRPSEGRVPNLFGQGGTTR
jgi:hypothetical protein